MWSDHPGPAFLLLTTLAGTKYQVSSGVGHILPKLLPAILIGFMTMDHFSSTCRYLRLLCPMGLLCVFEHHPVNQLLSCLSILKGTLALNLSSLPAWTSLPSGRACSCLGTSLGRNERDGYWCFCTWWLPIPVFLPGESHGQRSLRLQSRGSKRVDHHWPTNTFTLTAHEVLSWLA